MTKEVLFRRLDDLCRSLLDNLIDESQRVSIALRLWSGCLSAAKTIAIETRNGTMTPEKRKEIFRDIGRALLNKQRDSEYLRVLLHAKRLPSHL